MLVRKALAGGRDPRSPFASRPRRKKSRRVTAPAGAISGEYQIGGGLITSRRRCATKLSAPSDLSHPFRPALRLLPALLYRRGVYTLALALSGLPRSGVRPGLALRRLVP